ncbi:MAG TPA: SLBB domain-containing protein, partial [Candidatus Obscuribacterales bacterium]
VSDPPQLLAQSGARKGQRVPPPPPAPRLVEPPPAVSPAGTGGGPALKPLEPAVAPSPMPDSGGSTPDVSGVSPDAETGVEPQRGSQWGMTDRYILGPGDQLVITDFSLGDLGQPFRDPALPILPDGTINVHPIGVVKAAGLTLQEFVEKVNREAEKYYVKPDIDIKLSQVRPPLVYLTGEVLKPGLYPNPLGGVGRGEQGQAVGAAFPTGVLTLVSALQLAGGLKESADVRNIIVTRLNSKEPIRVNLWRMLIEGDPLQDIALQPGDVVYAPRGGADYDPDGLGLAANQARRIRVWGAVNSPGLFELTPDDDILSIIARAGGFQKTAVTRYVTLSRLNRDGTIYTRKIPVNKKRVWNDPKAVARSHVKPGDLVIAHDSIIKLGARATYNAGLAIGAGTLIVLFAALINKAVFPPTSGTTVSSPGVIPLLGAPGGGTTQ